MMRLFFRMHTCGTRHPPAGPPPESRSEFRAKLGPGSFAARLRTPRNDGLLGKNSGPGFGPGSGCKTMLTDTKSRMDESLFYAVVTKQSHSIQNPCVTLLRRVCWDRSPGGSPHFLWSPPFESQVQSLFHQCEPSLFLFLLPWAYHFLFPYSVFSVFQECGE